MRRDEAGSTSGLYPLIFVRWEVDPFDIIQNKGATLSGTYWMSPLESNFSHFKEIKKICNPNDSKGEDFCS